MALQSLLTALDRFGPDDAKLAEALRNAEGDLKTASRLLQDAVRLADRVQCDADRILRFAAGLPALGFEENLATEIKVNAKNIITLTGAFLKACQKEGI